MGCACVKPIERKSQKSDLKGITTMPSSIVGKRKEGQGVKQLKWNYKLGKETKIIGCGSFGKVYVTHRRKDPDSMVAIKVLDKA